MTQVVVGVGNPWRRDDGIGHAVVDALRGRVDPGVDLAVTDGEAARLIERWRDAEVAVVVDAVRSARPAGTVEVLDDPGAIAADASVSSHGLGLDAAVSLARRLACLPQRLVVVGVVGTDFSQGEGLTPAVAAAIPDAVGAVCAALRDGTRMPARPSAAKGEPQT